MSEIGPRLERMGLRTIRRVHFHDPDAPVATVVSPSVFVAVRNDQGQVLLVRRCDSGTWEFPGGRVDVGESAVEAALRETAEESGIRVRITGLVGLFTDPRHVIESAAGEETRQQFVACFHASLLWGTPRADLHETSDAAWFDPAEVAVLPVEPGTRLWIRHALSGAREPHFE
jgi:8-oxo-dGTP pyrophosphatase MutT (NUDIX family)